MKTHTTNYQNTFIAVADDSSASQGEVPPVKGDTRTAAHMLFELVSQNPYRYTSDDVLFQVYAERNELTEAELEEARKNFFSRGQACLRASALTKRYGWGIHHDQNGKIALCAVHSDAYEKHMQDTGLKVVKAMRSGK